MPNKERKGKWQPFDALEGYRAALENTEHQKYKKPKPEIMPDSVEEIDRILKEALQNHNEVDIEYYYDGYCYMISGNITKIDIINRTVIVNQKKINLDFIINIKNKN
ncbi:MAG: YolD-like family protein [Bacilli bacterium]|nr:YolD-like family protein [Bacilli bacterium]MDD4076546.1 YolD-like family protein [Bacilli bacterium]MDD4387746.1 YolD-like family protein [Bacilli bacterium]